MPSIQTGISEAYGPNGKLTRIVNATIDTYAADGNSFFKMLSVNPNRKVLKIRRALGWPAVTDILYFSPANTPTVLNAAVLLSGPDTAARLSEFDLPGYTGEVWVSGVLSTAALLPVCVIEEE